MLRTRQALHRTYDALAYLVLLLIAFFTFFPVQWTLLTSLKRNTDVVTTSIQYIPHNPTLENYVELWNRAQFSTLFLNSAIVMVMTVTLCLVVGITAAYSFSRYQFPGRDGFTSCPQTERHPTVPAALTA